MYLAQASRPAKLLVLGAQLTGLPPVPAQAFLQSVFGFPAEVYKWLSAFPSLHYKSACFNLCSAEFCQWYVITLFSEYLRNVNETQKCANL